MSFSTLRSYYRKVMAAVDADFREWEDGFPDDNIPSTIVHKSWHLSYAPFLYTGTAHTCLGFSTPITLKFFIKGYSCPTEGIDEGVDLAHAIIKEACAPINRLNDPLIKNVLPNTVDVQPLGSSNDNTIRVTIQFNNTFFI